METATFLKIGSRRAAGKSGQSPHNHRPLSWLLGLACIAASLVAQVHTQDANAGTLPWVPAVIEAIDPYVGAAGLDHFAASNSADQVGFDTAPLANGNRVVAGLVPDGNGNTCNNGTALCSIGLVQYTSAGQRVAWSNPGSNGRHSDQYSVYPGGSQNRYQYIRDVHVRGNFIDVLVDEPDAAHPDLTLGHRNVRVVTFRDDGSLLGQWTAFGFASAQSVDNVDFYGAQMELMSNGKLIVAATAYDASGPFIAVTRLAIMANGLPTVDPSWGIPYGGSPATAFNFWRTYSGPANYCGAQGFCDVTASFVAKQAGFPVQTDVYVAGSIHISGSDWDEINLKISSDTGDVKPEFNGTGWARVGFNDPNSTLDDRAAGLYVYQDEVYVAARVARQYHPGIGLAKLNGATGSYTTVFGFGGQMVFGGEGSDEQFPQNSPDDHVPFAISATGGRIGVVGYHYWEDQGGTDFVDPFLAVVSAFSGVILDLGRHPVQRGDGSRAGDAVFYGIYGGPYHGSPFTVSGNGRDTNAGNTLSYVTGTFFPLSGDRIFSDNFGIGQD